MAKKTFKNMSKNMKIGVYGGVGAAVATAIIVPVALVAGKTNDAPTYGGFRGTYTPTGNTLTERVYNDHQITTGNPAVAVITDGGDINDKSFNQSAIWGVQTWSDGSDATKTYRIFQVENVGATKADFDKQYTAANPTEAYVVSGYRHTSTGKIKTWWSANKSTTPVVAIDIADTTNDKFYGITFKTEQSGFMAAIDAGFLLNRQFKDEKSTAPIKVATFGGAKAASVTTYMNGFANGIKWWNANKAKHNPSGLAAATNRRDLELIHIDGDAQKDFSNSFDLGAGKPITNKFIDMGAKAIMAVAGQETKDVVDVIGERNAHGGIFAIGVDVDQSAIFGGDIITSAVKGMEAATTDLLANIYSSNHGGTGTPADKVYDITDNHPGGALYIGSVFNKNFISSSDDDHKRLNLMKSVAQQELANGTVDAGASPLWVPQFI